MTRLQQLILEAIMEANEGTSVTDTLIKRELGSMATRHFKGDREYTQAVHNVVSGSSAITQEIVQRAARQEVAGVPIGTTKWGGEWNPTAGNQTNVVPLREVEAAAVSAEVPNEPTTDSVEDLTTDPSAFVGWTGQKVIEHFGSLPAVKDYCRELGFQMNYRLKANNFLQQFIDYIDQHYGTVDPDTKLEEEE